MKWMIFLRNKSVEMLVSGALDGEQWGTPAISGTSSGDVLHCDCEGSLSWLPARQQGESHPGQG